MRRCRMSDDLSDEAFSAWANTMGDLIPEGTSERDRAARAWYEATRRTRANRWGPHAFPDEDLKRLWVILNPFSWTHGGTAEKWRQRWSEGRKGSNSGLPLWPNASALFKDAWINLSKQGGCLSSGGHSLTPTSAKKVCAGTVSAPGPVLSRMKAPIRLQV
jgi:hypothetical protein